MYKFFPLLWPNRIVTITILLHNQISLAIVEIHRTNHCLTDPMTKPKTKIVTHLCCRLPKIQTTNHHPNPTIVLHLCHFVWIRERERERDFVDVLMNSDSIETLFVIKKKIDKLLCLMQVGSRGV